MCEVKKEKFVKFTEKQNQMYREQRREQKEVEAMNRRLIRQAQQEIRDVDPHYEERNARRRMLTHHSTDGPSRTDRLGPHKPA